MGSLSMGVCLGVSVWGGVSGESITGQGSLFREGSLSMSLCLGSLCLGGSLSRRSLSRLASLCPVGYVHRVTVQGSLCPGDLCPWGLCPGEGSLSMGSLSMAV